MFKKLLPLFAVLIISLGAFLGYIFTKDDSTPTTASAQKVKTEAITQKDTKQETKQETSAPKTPAKIAKPVPAPVKKQVAPLLTATQAGLISDSLFKNIYNVLDQKINQQKGTLKTATPALRNYMTQHFLQTKMPAIVKTMCFSCDSPSFPISSKSGLQLKVIQQNAQRITLSNFIPASDMGTDNDFTTITLVKEEEKWKVFNFTSKTLKDADLHISKEEITRYLKKTHKNVVYVSTKEGLYKGKKHRKMFIFKHKEGTFGVYSDLADTTYTLDELR
ncbi:lipoprotein [Fictibacillus macauensis ZFHKF-1]|uniref:Lipoprotein n=1 Tax=Fictibacillus macauensis ZFHKF-1 TaxID=1196324 RepID=I8AKY8_9BACL|nr:hypothetical protein [Fictibacillus macauensis]EIT86264.1 lipoprotein [Fictibacillus macauensis ZFHKF-1]